MSTNIFPSDQILSRSQKEQLLCQKGIALWLTGLSGAGKTTIAIALEKELYKNGFLTQILDGDNLRAGINNNLGFEVSDRLENIRRVAEIAKLFVESGIVTICCFISPTEEIRNSARNIIGENDFVEIFVNTSLAICEDRDVKGLYKKARAGQIKDFTGIHSPYEIPNNPGIELKTDFNSMEENINKILNLILQRVKIGS